MILNEPAWPVRHAILIKNCRIAHSINYCNPSVTLGYKLCIYLYITIMCIVCFCEIHWRNEIGFGRYRQSNTPFKRKGLVYERRKAKNPQKEKDHNKLSEPLSCLFFSFWWNANILCIKMVTSWNSVFIPKKLSGKEEEAKMFRLLFALSFVFILSTFAVSKNQFVNTKTYRLFVDE